MAYLQDLTDAELLIRPVPGMNHAAWQLGHMIAGSKKMIRSWGRQAPALPAGFEEGYTKETAGFWTIRRSSPLKDVYLDLAGKDQGRVPGRAVDAIPESKLDDPGPEAMREYAPTVAAVLTLLGTHWLMHAGQFVAFRRKLGKLPMF